MKNKSQYKVINNGLWISEKELNRLLKENQNKSYIIIDKKNAKNFQNLIDFAEAYIDTYSIRRPGTIRLINHIKNEINKL